MSGMVWALLMSQEDLLNDVRRPAINNEDWASPEIVDCLVVKERPPPLSKHPKTQHFLGEPPAGLDFGLVPRRKSYCSIFLDRERKGCLPSSRLLQLNASVFFCGIFTFEVGPFGVGRCANCMQR